MDKLDVNQAYTTKRSDVLKIVPKNVRQVLDVGCSVGALGSQIKAYTGANVTGIELSEHMANEALSRIDKVIIGDASLIIKNGQLEKNHFDAIIFADLLEHLNDPWNTLAESVNLLNKAGVIIISIPNIRHISTIYSLIFKGYWPYNDRGIHDRTHLRFFTKKNIIELLDGANLEIDIIQTNYRFFDKPHKINRYAKYFAFPLIKNFLAYQYLIKASRKK